MAKLCRRRVRLALHLNMFIFLTHISDLWGADTLLLYLLCPKIMMLLTL